MRGPSKAARDKYREFQGFEPRHVGEFARDFRIPDYCYKMGPAVYEVYASDKVDPETDELPRGEIHYIHHHKPGVNLYRCDAAAQKLAMAKRVRVPQWIRNCRSLTLIGDCIEYQYLYGDDEVQAEATPPYPELYCTPNGHALLVISNKRFVAAMMWGGRLRVERRGIVG